MFKAVSMQKSGMLNINNTNKVRLTIFIANGKPLAPRPGRGV
jgi:hypothetical protein